MQRAYAHAHVNTSQSSDDVMEAVVEFIYADGSAVTALREKQREAAAAKADDTTLSRYRTEAHTPILAGARADDNDEVSGQHYHLQRCTFAVDVLVEADRLLLPHLKSTCATVLAQHVEPGNGMMSMMMTMMVTMEVTVTMMMAIMMAMIMAMMMASMMM